MINQRHYTGKNNGNITLHFAQYNVSLYHNFLHIIGRLILLRTGLQGPFYQDSGPN